MGENGKQARGRIIREIKDFLSACKALPSHRGQVNIKQLAKQSKINRPNFYDNEDVIRLVNRKAASLGLALLPLPGERVGLTVRSVVDEPLSCKTKEVTALEREVNRLEKRVTSLDSMMEDLTTENKKFKEEINRLNRQQFLDDLALRGRPVRDSRSSQQ